MKYLKILGLIVSALTTLIWLAEISGYQAGGYSQPRSAATTALGSENLQLDSSKFGEIICTNITGTSVGDLKRYNRQQDVWSAFNSFLMASGVRFHLEWGSLLGWYRDCKFLDSDHDLDIAVFASDWVPELEDGLLAVAKAHWCSGAKTVPWMLPHPDNRRLQTPIQIQIFCTDGSAKDFDMIDIIFVHRAALRPYGQDTTQADSSKPAMHRRMTSHQESMVWWETSDYARKYWVYSPYSLVPAIVFGQNSMAPADTAEHLLERYPDWNVVNSYEAYTEGPLPTHIWGNPRVRGVEEFADEWWHMALKGESMQRVSDCRGRVAGLCRYTDRGLMLKLRPSVSGDGLLALSPTLTEML